jgi:hypothetical protein
VVNPKVEMHLEANTLGASGLAEAGWVGFAGCARGLGSFCLSGKGPTLSGTGPNSRVLT